MPIIARYLTAILALNLPWEALQLPLYTIWTTGTSREITWAVAHCTVGDGVIAAAALGIGWLLTGRPRLRHGTPLLPAAVTVALGMMFTIASEWRATEVTHAWAYSELMPIVPRTPLGLSPLLQWLILPPIAMRLTLGRPSHR